MPVIEYESPKPPRPSRCWKRRDWIAVAAIAAFHMLGSFLIFNTAEPPPAQSNFLFTAVGPDGGHEPSLLVMAYEFPTVFLIPFLGMLPVGSGGLPLAGFNGLVWGLTLVAARHWWQRENPPMYKP